jgi:hypothetical protein
MRKSLVVAAALLMTFATNRSTVARQADTGPIHEGRSICVPYNPATLYLTEARGTWLLSRADGARFKTFADREDAEAGLAIAKENNQLCYIGKSNTRPNRERYIMEYWRKR